MSDDDLDWLLRRVGRAPARPLETGFVDVRYELGALLGEGGFGTVYEAFDRVRGERVALKLLHRATSEALLRFKKEFRELARLADPSFVRLYDLHGERERWYFTMERVDGVPFDVWAREPDRLRPTLDQLCAALARLHRRGWVHRDVKPSNVLVEPRGRVVLLDFGLLHAVDDERSTAVAGTPIYVAPEVVAGAPPTPASDWYSVGVMLYEALTGETPFPGARDETILRKQTSRASPVREVAPHADVDLATLCDALLDPDPAKRPVPHTTELPIDISPPFVGREDELAQLERALAGSPSVVRVVGPSGVGKSTLVERFAREARRRGVHVLLSRCHPREHGQFVAIDGIVDELARMLARMPPARTRAIAPREKGALVRAFSVLASIPGFERDDERPGPRSRVGRALWDMLSRWTDAARWLVVIDDAQWGDADSAALLEEVLLEGDLPICVVFVHRTDSTGPLIDGITSEMHEVRVEAFREDEARALAELSGAKADVEALVREARGHALLLVELARERARGGSSRSLREVVVARLEEVPKESVRCARMLAVAGRPVPLDVLFAAGIPAAAVDALSDVRLVTLHDRSSVCIRHDRIAEVIAGTIEAGEVRTLHGELAQALLAVGPERSELLAFHFEEAGDLQRASAYLLRAARAATAARAFAQARTLYAKLLSTRERARIRDGLDRTLREESAEASAHAGMSVEAADLFLSAAREASEEEALLLRVRAAEQLLTAGHLQRGERILDEQLGQLGLSIPSSTTGRLLGVVRDTVGLRVDRWRTRATSEARLTALWSAFRAALIVEPVRALALGTCLVREAARPGATAHARLAASFITALSAVAPRGPDALPRALALIDAELIDRSDPKVVQLHAMCQGIIENMGLAFRASVTSFERAVRITAQHGLGQSFEETMSRTMQGASAFVLGDVGFLRQHIPPLCAELHERDYLIAWLLAALHRTWLDLLEHGAAAASSQLDEIARRWTSRGQDLQGWWFDIARIHTALVRGDGRTAWTLSRPQARRYRERVFATLMHRLEAQTFLVRSVICLAKEKRASGDEIAKAHAIIEQLARVPSAWARANVHCLRAGLASALGDQELTRTALSAATGALEDAGMVLYRCLVEDALGCVEGGDEGAARVRRARERLASWRVNRDVAMSCTLPGAW